MNEVASELVLYAGCLPATPFRELVDAAAWAKFDALTVWPLIYRRAQSREGLDPSTMRRIVEDAGLRITDLDPCGDWLPPPADDAAVPTLFRSIWTRRDFFDAAAALGADCIAAVDLSGAAVSHDIAVEGFAQLCDDAADHGLRVALEFMPFSGIADANDAIGIVTEAGKPNGGLVLDLCHFARSNSNEAVLQSLPTDQVFAIQLGDGPLDPPNDLRDEAMFHRQLPGDGAFRLSEHLRTLASCGVHTRVGPEIYQRGFSERPARAVAADLWAATRRVLGLDPHQLGAGDPL
ncbi:MAG: 4-hydroxyphenylpyruvate dioxygenase [Acidimicrobiia bacterium]|nr:4-hydroxyphenylpyruvate dioxygenase [Acidimicrobiia bacterium]